MKSKIEYIPIVKTIPEISKNDGGVYTCSIGYSPQIGFIRVYPLPLYGMKRWGIYEIEVERNKRDSRAESWKLSSYTRHENFIGFEKDAIYKGDCNKSNLLKLMQLNASPSISKLNKDRKSIGFIESSHINAYWESNNRYINSTQIGMFNDVEIADFCKYTKETRQKESRITFVDGDGKHNVQLNDWQYYEYQRKFGANVDAFRHVNTASSKIIVIGNMFQYRSVWLALGVFNAIKTPNKVGKQNVINF